jgi:uncharacterized membrane protein YfcA
MGVTGFGFNLLVVPILVLVWDVKAGVAAGLFLGLLSNIPLLIEVRSHIRFRPVFILLIGSAIGTPLGLAMLVLVDADVLKLWVGAVVIAMALLYAFSPRLHFSSQNVGGALSAGLIGGVLGGSTGINGPPIVFYLLGREGGIEDFRCTIMAYFLPAGAMVLLGFIIAGRITGEVLAVVGLSLPALLLGLFLGSRVRRRLAPAAFRSVVLGTLVLTSCAIIASVLFG